jgi:hypothetical protein
VRNSATVVRLPELTPIDVSRIQLAQSVDNAFVQMSMDLANPDHLELLKADVDGPKSVQITINGYVWTAIVEDWSRDREHPGKRVSVSGRSRSALLDAPYAPLRSKVAAADRQLQQLVDEELDLTGFTVDFQTITWLVPGGVFHYDAQTPIAAVATLAAGAGAVVQAHPWDDVLVIAPRYPVSPWQWASSPVDRSIQDDVILRDSSRRSSKPLYDYVLVSGEQVGVSDPIIRDGAAGEIRAPMIVDPLITDHTASSERGRNVLSDRGEQASVEITIPLFAIDIPDRPGLVQPLHLVEVVEPTSWRGLCVGVEISATMQQSGSAAVLVVEQTVTLERHYSDAG